MRDDPRRRILDRRAAFIAAAVAGVTVNCTRCNPLVCLSVEPIDASATVDAGPDSDADGQEDADAVADALADADADAGATTDAPAKPKPKTTHLPPKEPIPMACLWLDNK